MTSLDRRSTIAGIVLEHSDARAMSTPELISYIVSRHHAHLYAALPFLAPLAAKVARVHGDHNPKLLALRDALDDLPTETRLRS
jgi:iron-sulfur cluster repair protein YtfE (RIC family)